MKKILVYFLLYSHAIFCQNYIYEEFGLNDGLPSNQVYDIYQAKNNVIWFATDRGIASYNGYEFKAYGVNDGLLNNCVLDFYPQENGTIYCTTVDNQLFYFNDDFEGFYKYEHSDTVKQFLRYDQKITSIYIDSAKSFHFGCDMLYQPLIISKNGQILSERNIVYNDEAVSFFVKFKSNASKHIPNYKSYSSQCPPGYLCFNFDDRVSHDFKICSFNDFYVFLNPYYVSLLNKEGIEFNRIQNKLRPTCIIPISNEQLFIGYLFGGGKIVDTELEDQRLFLPKKSVTRFLIDKEGGYWFTTLYSGVHYLKNPNINSIQNPIKEPINSLSTNSKNELVIGYENGSISELKDNQKEETILKQNNTVRAFVEYNPFTQKNILYSETLLDLGYPIKINNRNFIRSLDGVYLTKIAEATDKRAITSNLWSIYIYNLINKDYIIDQVNLTFRAHDACFYEKDIYLCSATGLYLFSNDTVTFLGEKSKYLNYRADDIDVNIKKNELYMATIGSGMVVYQVNSDSAYAIREKDGLFSNIVNEVYIENENDIWACTNSGLNKIHFNADGSYQITGLRSTDGLPNDGITDIEIINDTVWIGSKKGLVYAPKSIFESKINNVDYNIEIKRVKVNDSIVNQIDFGRLKHTENRIDFFVETVSQKYGTNIKYRYKLIGLEKDYRISRHREINYSSLPAGKYIFTVQSINEDGDVMSDPLDFPFTIRPPYWKTWWFRLLITLGLLGIIYLFFKLRILSYNKSISGEVLRMILKRLKRKERYFTFKDGTREKRIKSDTITYVKSDGNYLRVFTEEKNYLIRCKIGEFIELTPDPKEYIRVHRSYIIRIDKVDSKAKQELIISGQKIPVSNTYEKELQKLIF
ncbi:MAG: LytTR family transcriptional regulator DNA-binding domain-containing protein [Crocinitomicaceae bacterium]